MCAVVPGQAPSRGTNRLTTDCPPDEADRVIELSEQQIIDQLARRLADAHASVAPDRVAAVVHEEYARFTGRPIRDFVPLFVERNAKAELSRLGS